MPRGIVRTVVLAVAVLTAGCLDFEEQTVTYRYDKATDTLRVFQDYHGIFGDDKGQPDALTPKELEQLDSVLSTEQTFLFDNWIWKLDKEKLRREIEELSELPAEERTPSKVSNATLQRQLLNAVHIENGPVYFDTRHRLSGVQQVTITHVTALIAAANDFLAADVREPARMPDVTPRDREPYLRAFAERREFIRRCGNAFFVRFPVTREDYEKDEDDHEWLRKGGIGVVFADDEATLRIGLPSDVVTAITLPVRMNDYVPNAVDSFRRRVTVLDAFDPISAARIFLRTASSQSKARSK